MSQNNISSYEMADKKSLVCVTVDHSNASHVAEPRIITKRGGVGKLLVKKRSISSIPADPNDLVHRRGYLI